MSTYLARLKQLECKKSLLYSLDALPSEPAKPSFDPFGSIPRTHIIKYYSPDEMLREIDLLINFVSLNNEFTEQDTIKAEKNVQNIETSLGRNEQGKQVWAYKDAELGMSDRILVLHAEDPDLNQTEIAHELEYNRSTVLRAFKRAEQKGIRANQRAN